MMKILKNFSKNEGYSFIDIFILLLFISLISTIIYTNSTDITRATSKTLYILNSNYDLLRLRVILTKECQSIKPPYFIGKHLYTKKLDSIDVYYYNGYKEQYLTIEINKDKLKIYTNSSLIFSSSNLFGTFTLEENYLNYVENNIKFSFPLGVIFV